VRLGLLIVLEDLHWADPVSLLVVRVADAVAARRNGLLARSRHLARNW
jgi:predicted ATPase